jgi:hypothetical protein
VADGGGQREKKREGGNATAAEPAEPSEPVASFESFYGPAFAAAFASELASLPGDVDGRLLLAAVAATAGVFDPPLRRLMLRDAAAAAGRGAGRAAGEPAAPNTTF